MQVNIALTFDIHFAQSVEKCAKELEVVGCGNGATWNWNYNQPSVNAPRGSAPFRTVISAVCVCRLQQIGLSIAETSSLIRLFVNIWFMATADKIITYTLGEHDLRSPHDEVTSSEL